VPGWTRPSLHHLHITATLPLLRLSTGVVQETEHVLRVESVVRPGVRDRENPFHRPGNPAQLQVHFQTVVDVGGIEIPRIILLTAPRVVRIVVWVVWEAFGASRQPVDIRQGATASNQHPAHQK